MITEEIIKKLDELVKMTSEEIMETPELEWAIISTYNKKKTDGGLENFWYAIKPELRYYVWGGLDFIDELYKFDKSGKPYTMHHFLLGVANSIKSNSFTEFVKRNNIDKNYGKVGYEYKTASK